MQSPTIVDVVDEARKVGSDMLKRSHKPPGKTTSTFSVFMKLSALALS
jgi:hypothetical protein